MKISDGEIILSATDLTSHFECGRKVWLDLDVSRGNRERPGQSEIERRMLERRGRAHEVKVLEFFRALGKDVVPLGADPITEESGPRLHAATLEAMGAGAEVIYQGTFVLDGWIGRPDFLIRVDTKSDLGDFSYEPLDAKLARDETARAVLQLCVYGDLLRQIQGRRPDNIWLALGHAEIEPVKLRALDYSAYYEQSKHQLVTFTSSPAPREPEPEPCEHCDICSWWLDCETKRRNDDHLSLVAGITKRQRGKLVSSGVDRLAKLAALSPSTSVDGIEMEPLERIRHQAQLQESRRRTGSAEFDLLTDGDPRTGLELLPAPSPGDLFLDLEGDAFAQEGGLEYLFGLVELGKPEFDFTVRKKPGPPNYLHFWATNPAEEKVAFERVMDRIFEGLDELPDMHVFHFGHRENNALKVLSCRHGTREDQVDELLRRGVLVDLHAVVRQSLRASVEAYSLKELEVFHGFSRKVEKRDAAKAMQYFGWWLETGEEELPLKELKKILLEYNEEDCLSTWKLREWLEGLRPELEQKLGRSLERPVREEKETNPKVDERQKEQEDLARRLLAGLPSDPREDSPSDQARRLLANLMGWHWRELKSSYWEYHEARKVPQSERLDDRFCLTGLTYEGVVDTVDRSEIHRYRFLDQEHAIRTVPEPEDADSEKTKKINVVEVGPDYIDIKRGNKRSNDHPTSLRPGRPIASNHQESRLLDVVRSIASDGLANRDSYATARDLLTRTPPRCGQALGQALVIEGEDTVEAVKRLCLTLDSSVLPIQGPPGSGKTYRAVEAILALVRAGKRVGVTANSHKVITELLKKVAKEAKGEIRIHHIDDADKYNEPPFSVHKNYAEVREGIESGKFQVVGGTTFAWCREEFVGALHLLLVDEAGQVSLANALAVSTAAKNLVLLGDPAQLDQPQKGTHPPGAEVSALEHVLGESTTIPSDRGVFLAETRRLHPEICRFTSSVFYEGRLEALDGLEHQRIQGSPPFDGVGLRFVSIQHEGNTNRSEEEVAEVERIVNSLLSASTSFTNAKGETRPLRPKDILVVAPYNSQVGALRHRLPDEVEVGTVDKFQGMEAPIVIYSMTTSTGEEAPRGLEFLYSLNRLNVATSRAQAMVILVASPKLTEARCRTPRQLKLVNALCSYMVLSRAEQSK